MKLLRIRVLATMIVLVGAVLACTGIDRERPLSADAALQVRILAGTVELQRSADPVYRLLIHQQMRRLYNQQDWEELGMYVARENIKDAHSYYFLAQAAWWQEREASASLYLARGREELRQGNICTVCDFPPLIDAALNELDGQVNKRCGKVWNAPCCVAPKLLKGWKQCQ